MLKGIEIRQLSIGYKSKGETVVVASDLNEVVGEGTLVCLAGPNGAGKSTLLKTISGFIAPLSGSVDFNGKKISSISHREMAKYLAVVLTQRGHYNAMTGRELVGLGRSPYTGFFGRLSANDNAIVERCIEAVGASSFAHRPVSTLSDGERQKLLIAKALAQTTAIIVLDEPTAYLDYPSKVEVMKLLYELSKKENKIIFISTHDLDIAFAISDSLWLISKELGLTAGTVDELGDNGTIERYFTHKGLTYNSETKHFNINK